MAATRVNIPVLIREKRGEPVRIVAPSIPLWINDKKILSVGKDKYSQSRGVTVYAAACLGEILSSKIEAEIKNEGKAEDQKKSAIHESDFVMKKDSSLLAFVAREEITADVTKIISIVDDYLSETLGDFLKPDITAAIQRHVNEHKLNDLTSYECDAWQVRQTGISYQWLDVEIKVNNPRCSIKKIMPNALLIVILVGLAISEYYDAYYNVQNDTSWWESLSGVISDFIGTLPTYILSNFGEAFVDVFNFFQDLCRKKTPEELEQEEKLEEDFRVSRVRGKSSYFLLALFFVIKMIGTGVAAWAAYVNRIEVLDTPEHSSAFLLGAKLSYWEDKLIDDFSVPFSFAYLAVVKYQEYVEKNKKRHESKQAALKLKIADRKKQKEDEKKDEAKKHDMPLLNGKADSKANGKASAASPEEDVKLWVGYDGADKHLLRKRRSCCVRWCTWFGKQDRNQESEFTSVVADYSGMSDDSQSTFRRLGSDKK